MIFYVSINKNKMYDPSVPTTLQNDSYKTLVSNFVLLSSKLKLTEYWSIYIYQCPVNLNQYIKVYDKLNQLTYFNKSHFVNKCI